MFQRRLFSDLDINDDIFASLRADYPDFNGWFKRKLAEPIWVETNGDILVAVMYLKIEDDACKLGMLKVRDDWSGVGIGTRAISLALEYARDHNCRTIYGTIFPHHHEAIDFVTCHGFSLHDEKTDTGENVFSRHVLTQNELSGTKQ